MQHDILIVDDDPAILATVAEILHDEGYSVRTAGNGMEGLAALEQQLPALVLLDMRMPVLDGWGFVQAMRERGLTPGVDIAVAGFDDIEMLQDVVPSLTTVSLPLRELGERSLELALAEAPVEQQPIRGEVTLRDSTPRRG